MEREAPRESSVGSGVPRARGASALRRLGHALMGHDAADDLLGQVAVAADRVAADLEDGRALFILIDVSRLRP